jgi:small subunit ribosomal protein S20
LPHRKSAIKALKQAKKRTTRNKAIESELHTRVKKFRTLLQEKNLEQARKDLRIISSRFDKASVKNIIHQKKASRYKSRLAIALQKAEEIK